MLKNVHISFLTLAASSGYALALLGAISTLWSNTPSQEGLEQFAFSLATIMATVLGNLFLFGCHLLISRRGAFQFLNAATGALSTVVFLLGVVTATVFFTEGLNTWFTIPPQMPEPLIMVLRLVVVIPFLWLVIILAATTFSKDRPKTR